MPLYSLLGVAMARIFDRKKDPVYQGFSALIASQTILGQLLGVANAQESIPQLAPIFASTCIGTTSGAASHMSFETCADILLFLMLKPSSS
jgi:hypothetical protein